MCNPETSNKPRPSSQPDAERKNDESEEERLDAAIEDIDGGERSAGLIRWKRWSAERARVFKILTLEVASRLFSLRQPF